MYTKLIERKEELGYTNEYIHKQTGVSERTIARIFSKSHQEHKRGCSVDTLRPILNLLGLSFEDIFDDAKVFIGGHTYAEMQDKIRSLKEKIDELITDNTTIKAERDFANADNAILKNEITTLTAEIKLLNMQLSYKDEIIALYKIIEQERNK